jgi:hypothetical protein
MSAIKFFRHSNRRRNTEDWHIQIRNSCLDA